MKTLYLISLVQATKETVIIVCETESSAKEYCSFRNAVLAGKTKAYYTWNLIKMRTN